MATINATNLTLLDHAKRLDPDGSIAQIVEILTQRNPLLEDASWIEGNLPTGHRFTSRSALPSVAWRKFNEGTPTSKSRTSQVDETCGILSTRSTLDVDLAELNGNTAAFRASEEAAFLQALNNEVENGMFYHSTATAPEKFQGLAPRLASTTGTGGSQIVKADAAPSGADQTSIWLVGWGDNGVSGIFPKGSMAGLQSTDLGKQLVPDSPGGNEFVAYVTDWKWKLGLMMKDYRRLARVCNIDTSAITATSGNIIPAMIRAFHLVDLNGVRGVWYVNRTVGTYLHLQALQDVKNSTLTIENVGGKPVTMFLGLPVRETDGILNNEAVIA